jgi:hypothetical protein
MSMLEQVHSLVRWLVVLSTLVTALRYLYGWLAGQTFGDLDRTLWRVFQGVFGLQILIGLVLLLGGFNGLRAEHAVTMLLAFGLTHVSGRFREAADKVRFRNGFLLLVLTFVLIYAGVARLLGWGWLTAGL